MNDNAPIWGILWDNIFKRVDELSDKKDAQIYAFLDENIKEVQNANSCKRKDKLNNKETKRKKRKCK